MLRQLVAALLLANLGYFAWSQYWLAPLGFAPSNPSEAYRLAQQIRPEAMRLLPHEVDAAAVPTANTPFAPASATVLAAALPLQASSNSAAPALGAAPTAPMPAAAASAASRPAAAASIAVQTFAVSAPATLPSPAASAAIVSAAPPAANCLQIGVFTDAQAQPLRERLQTTMPDGSWRLMPVLEPARWIIYMGRYASDETVAKKRKELRARGVAFEPVQNPALNPGLSLGHFASKADADRELAQDAERGVRTARVIQERPEVRGQLLTLPNANADITARMAGFKSLLAGKAPQSCR